jgi:hypothetical protein
MFFHSSSVEGVSFDELHEGQKVSYHGRPRAERPVCRERPTDIVRLGLAVYPRPRLLGQAPSYFLRRMTKWQLAQGITYCSRLTDEGR